MEGIIGYFLLIEGIYSGWDQRETKPGRKCNARETPYMLGRPFSLGILSRLADLRRSPAHYLW